MDYPELNVDNFVSPAQVKTSNNMKGIILNFNLTKPDHLENLKGALEELNHITFSSL